MIRLKKFLELQDLVHGEWYTCICHKQPEDVWIFKFNSIINERIYYLKTLCRQIKYSPPDNFKYPKNEIQKANMEEVYKYFPEERTKESPKECSKEEKEIKMSEFKKGDYIVTLEGNFEGTWCAKKNYCFKQRIDLSKMAPEKDIIHTKVNQDSSYSFDKTKNLTDWRYATKEEIVEYDRIGKPYDVTTLRTSVNNDSLKEKSSIIHWSVGTYVVYKSDAAGMKFKKGEINRIVSFDNNKVLNLERDIGILISSSYFQNLEWFPTLKEAENYSRTIKGFIRDEDKSNPDLGYVVYTSDIFSHKKGTISPIIANKNGDIFLENKDCAMLNSSYAILNWKIFDSHVEAIEFSNSLLRNVGESFHEMIDRSTPNSCVSNIPSSMWDFEKAAPKIVLNKAGGKLLNRTECLPRTLPIGLWKQLNSPKELTTPPIIQLFPSKESQISQTKLL